MLYVVARGPELRSMRKGKPTFNLLFTGVGRVVYLDRLKAELGKEKLEINGLFEEYRVVGIMASWHADVYHEPVHHVKTPFLLVDIPEVL